MKLILSGSIAILISMITWSCTETQKNDSDKMGSEMMIRIAEIEIYPQYFDEYVSILKEEAAASVQLESGVICIFPMFIEKNPSQIRLIEIYASRKDYESHLKTPHFLKYKTSTTEMIKSLDLIDMESIDPESMSQIFSKMK